MRLAFLEIGQVGSALAGRFAKLGYEVAAAANDANSASVKAAQEKIPSLRVLPVREAATWAEVLFLATPFDADEAALRDAGDLTGKVVVDCTNPVGPGVTHGLGGRVSGGSTSRASSPVREWSRPSRSTASRTSSTAPIRVTGPSGRSC